MSTNYIPASNVPKETLDKALDRLLTTYPDNSSILITHINVFEVLSDLIDAIVIASHYKMLLDAKTLPLN